MAELDDLNSFSLSADKSNKTTDSGTSPVANELVNGSETNAIIAAIKSVRQWFSDVNKTKDFQTLLKDVGVELTNSIYSDNAKVGFAEGGLIVDINQRVVFSVSKDGVFFPDLFNSVTDVITAKQIVFDAYVGMEFYLSDAVQLTCPALGTNTVDIPFTADIDLNDVLLIFFDGATTSNDVKYGQGVIYPINLTVTEIRRANAPWARGAILLQNGDFYRYAYSVNEKDGEETPLIQSWKNSPIGWHGFGDFVWILGVNSPSSGVIKYEEGVGLTLLDAFGAGEPSFLNSDFSIKNLNEFYGVSNIGGANGTGAIFEFDLLGNTLNVLHSFDNAGGGGRQPLYCKPLRHDGNLWGTAQFGGTAAEGTVWTYDIDTLTYTDIWNADDENLEQPYGSLILADNGFIYGVCRLGGTHSKGGVIKINPTTLTVTKIYQFTGSTPFSQPVQMTKNETSGEIFINCIGGSTSSILRLVPSTDTVTLAYQYTSSIADGEDCFDGLAQDPDTGIMYGVNQNGGTGNFGNLFSFDPATDTYTVLYEESNAGDGAKPVGRPMLKNGFLYGSSQNGGTSDYGYIWKYEIATDTFTVLEELGLFGYGQPQHALYPYHPIEAPIRDEVSGSKTKNVLNGIRLVNNVLSLDFQNYTNFDAEQIGTLKVAAFPR